MDNLDKTYSIISSANVDGEKGQPSHTAYVNKTSILDTNVLGITSALKRTTKLWKKNLSWSIMQREKQNIASAEFCTSIIFLSEVCSGLVPHRFTINCSQQLIYINKIQRIPLVSFCFSIYGES